VTSDWGTRSYDYLGPFGAWASTSSNANAVTVVDAASPTMTGSTSASLSGWGNTYHCFITTFPASFHPVVTVSGVPADLELLTHDVICAP